MWKVSTKLVVCCALAQLKHAGTDAKRVIHWTHPNTCSQHTWAYTPILRSTHISDLTIYIYIYTCIHIYIYIYALYIYIYIYTRRPPWMTLSSWPPPSGWRRTASMCIHMYRFVCIYIYIERERYVYTYMYMYMYMYIYIYMYMYRPLHISHSHELFTPCPPIKGFPIKSPWVKLSGRLPIKFNGHGNSHPLELRVCLSQTLWNPNS